MIKVNSELKKQIKLESLNKNSFSISTILKDIINSQEWNYFKLEKIIKLIKIVVQNGPDILNQIHTNITTLSSREHIKYQRENHRWLNLIQTVCQLLGQKIQPQTIYKEKSPGTQAFKDQEAAAPLDNTLTQYEKLVQQYFMSEEYKEEERQRKRDFGVESNGSETLSELIRSKKVKIFKDEIDKSINSSKSVSSCNYSDVLEHFQRKQRRRQNGTHHDPLPPHRTRPYFSEDEQEESILNSNSQSDLNNSLSDDVVDVTTLKNVTAKDPTIQQQQNIIKESTTIQQLISQTHKLQESIQLINNQQRLTMHPYKHFISFDEWKQEWDNQECNVRLVIQANNSNILQNITSFGEEFNFGIINNRYQWSPNQYVIDGFGNGTRNGNPNKIPNIVLQACKNFASFMDAQITANEASFLALKYESNIFTNQAFFNFKVKTRQAYFWKACLNTFLRKSFEDLLARKQMQYWISEKALNIQNFVKPNYEMRMVEVKFRQEKHMRRGTKKRGRKHQHRRKRNHFRKKRQFRKR